MNRPARRHAHGLRPEGASNGIRSVRIRFFEGVYRLVRYRAWWVLFVSLLFSTLALYAIRDLPIKESLLDLLPQDDPLIEQFKLRYEELQQSDSLVVLLQLTQPSDSVPENERLLTSVAEPIVNQVALYPEVTTAGYQIDGKIATFAAIGENQQLLVPFSQAIDALQQNSVAVLQLIGKRLEIYYGNGQQVLSFVPQQLGGAASQLGGTSWSLDAYGALTEPRLADGAITLAFSQDEGLSGFAGCNPYTGFYTANSGALNISNLTSEQARCETPPNVMQLEQLYLTALQNAQSYFYGDLNEKSQWLNGQLQTLVDGGEGEASNVINIDVGPVVTLIQSTQRFGSQVNNILSQAPERVADIQQDVNHLLGLLNELEVQLQTPLPDVSEDGHSLRLVIRPSQASFESLKFNQRVLDLVDQALKDFLPQDGSIRAYVAGSYSFTAESNQTLRVDMFYTTLISIAGIALVFLLTFRGIVYPMLVIIPLSMSAVWTTAWAKYALGGFNLVTALLPALLLGLGINYGIHFVGRFTEERKRGLSTSRALYETILHKGNAMLSGAVTTTLVFLVMMLSQSRGLYEMGVVAAFGVMMSAVLTLLVLPSLIVVTHLVLQRWIDPDAGYRWTMAGLVAGVLRFRRAIIVLVLLATAGMFSPASEVRIQFVSEELMSTGLETQKARAALRDAGFGETEGAGDFFLFFADSETQAQQLEDALRASPFVIEALSVSDYFERTSILYDLDLDQMFSQGENLVNDLFLQLSGTRTDLDAQLQQTEGVLRTWKERLEQFGQRNALELINDALDQLVEVRQGFNNLDLRELQRSLLQIETAVNALRDVVSRTLVLPETIEGFINELPDEMKSQLITSADEIIVYAQLNKSIYLAGNYQTFIDAVDPITTNYIGMPMIQRQLEVAMERDFWVATLGAFGLIFLSLLIDFAPYRMLLRAPLLVMLPLGLGYVWMLGGMGLLNLSFNLTNMVISPLLIGIGVDNGIHLLHRYLENKGEPNRVQRSTQSVAMPVIIANLATIAAFGSLLFATTPGLPVLGKSAVIGVGSVAICSLTLLPAVLAGRR